jgi:hypothetical protein
MLIKRTRGVWRYEVLVYLETVFQRDRYKHKTADHGDCYRELLCSFLLS